MRRIAEEVGLVGRHRFDDLTAEIGACGLNECAKIVDRGETVLANDRPKPALEQVVLVGAEHNAGFRVHVLLEKPVIRGLYFRKGAWHRYPHAFRAIRITSGMTSSSGRTQSARPAPTMAPGIPQTTLEASSCARIRAPRAFRISVPRRPSCPMPVKTTAITAPPSTSLTELKSAST